MKRFTTAPLSALLILALLILGSSVLQAQTCDSTGVKTGGQGRGFIDADGDGKNDNARDHDGDGIPNGQDPDYVRIGAGAARGFIDTDGDGINDRLQDFDGDGIPNGKDPDYVRPRDGSGRRLMSARGGANALKNINQLQNCTGTCRGTGSVAARGAGGRRGGR